jgi:hypothetical protein
MMDEWRLVMSREEASLLVMIYPGERCRYL